MNRSLSILLLACFCASCKTEPNRADISQQAVVRILPAPMPQSLADIPQRSVSRPVQSPQSVVPSLPKPITLAWDWDAQLWFSNSTDVYVYASPNLKTWAIKTNSISSALRSNCPTKFVFPNNQPAEFYQVLVTNVSLRTGWFVTTTK